MFYKFVSCAPVVVSPVISCLVLLFAWSIERLGFPGPLLRSGVGLLLPFLFGETLFNMSGKISSLFMCYFYMTFFCLKLLEICTLFYYFC